MIRKQIALGALVAMVALCLSSADTLAQGGSSPIARGHCTRPLVDDRLADQSRANQSRIGEMCREVAAGERGVRAVLARFYSGRAFNNAERWSDAITQLNVAVNAGQDPEITGRLTNELRVARLELVNAYRANNQLDVARHTLENSGLSPADPGYSFQSAMLTLDELNDAGQVSAFDDLRSVFTLADSELRRTRERPTGLPVSEIRRGRSWLYRLGTTLGREALDDALETEGRTDAQRRADAARAAGYLRPATAAIAAACPSNRPLSECRGFEETSAIGSLGREEAPNADDLLNTYVQLGVAHLRAAGVKEMSGLAPSGAPSALALDCFSAGSRGPNVRPGAPSSLADNAESQFRDARTAFQTAVDRGAGAPAVERARWGLSCSILANAMTISNPREQQGELARAVDLLGDPNDALILLTRARAQVLRGRHDNARADFDRALSGSSCPRVELDDPDSLRSRIRLERARTYFTPTASGVRPSSDLFSRTITEIGQTTNLNGLRDAVPDLECARYLNPANSEARLILGHIYMRLQPISDSDPAALDPSPFNKTLEALRYFERPIGSGPEGRAEGLYLLSRRETLLQQNRILNGAGPAGDRDRAVNNAMLAYNMSQEPVFRQQACMAQMVFGRRLDEEVYCSASGEGDQLAESLLFEGMYYLRRGQSEPHSQRMRSWSRAIQSFNRGLADPSSSFPVRAVVHPSIRTQPRLSELLRYGERFVLRCGQLGYNDPDRADPEVRSFFQASGMPMPQCGGDRR
jgi:tetratricopeptide (TPR) repeat protein